MADEAQAPPTMPIEQMAKFLETTEQELMRLQRQGHIPKLKKGGFPQAETIRAYIRYLRNRPCTIEEAGEYLGKSGQWIRTLTAEGYIQAKRGELTLDLATKGYIAFLTDENRRSNQSRAESGLREARQKEVELRIAERNRLLIPQEEAIQAMGYVCGAIREGLSSLPIRFTRDLEMRAKLETEVDDVLARVAEAARSAGRNLRIGIGPAPAGGEDDT